ncbi:hypothetical protein [Burkholderia pseudomultivorans]|uniref:hypothetical protein n=1 Tax=Burkholderia pseudomultivorans TaxID=1207504 RepID=UPI0012D886E9|nr:hypothetical protein [Burkholderia pseudomultivorans]
MVVFLGMGCTTDHAEPHAGGAACAPVDRPFDHGACRCRGISGALFRPSKEKAVMPCNTRASNPRNNARAALRIAARRAFNAGQRQRNRMCCTG